MVEGRRGKCRVVGSVELWEGETAEGGNKVEEGKSGKDE